MADVFNATRNGFDGFQYASLCLRDARASGIVLIRQKRDLMPDETLVLLRRRLCVMPDGRVLLQPDPPISGIGLQDLATPVLDQWR